MMSLWLFRSENNKNLKREKLIIIQQIAHQETGAPFRSIATRLDPRSLHAWAITFLVWPTNPTSLLAVSIVSLNLVMELISSGKLTPCKNLQGKPTH